MSYHTRIYNKFIICGFVFLNQNFVTDSVYAYWESLRQVFDSVNAGDHFLNIAGHRHDISNLARKFLLFVRKKVQDLICVVHDTVLYVKSNLQISLICRFDFCCYFEGLPRTFIDNLKNLIVIFIVASLETKFAPIHEKLVIVLKQVNIKVKFDISVQVEIVK